MKVIDHLNKIDYSTDYLYQPSNFAIKFVNMIKLINGSDGEENVTPVTHYRMLDTLARGDARIVNLCFRGAAKLQSGSSPVLTPRGWTTMAEVQEGDKVINRYGEESTVLLKTEPKYPQMYLMTLCDGTQLEVGDEHNHLVQDEQGQEHVLTTLQLLGKEDEYVIPLASAVEFEEQDLAIDPYSLGYALESHANPNNHAFYAQHEEVRAQCLLGSIQQRLSFLQGCMDRRGIYADSGHYIYPTSLPTSKEYLVACIQSLGGYATTYPRGVQFRLSFSPFKLHRNAVLGNPELPRGKQIKSIVPMQCKEAGYCIALDSSDSTYLTTGYTVTHNTTVMGEYLVFYIALFGGLDGFGKIPLMLYVSDSIDNGVKNFRKNIESRFDNSEFLQTYLKFKPTDVRLEFINKEDNKFIVKGYGAKTGVRGVKEQGTRPRLAVLDDLISDEDARSETVISSVEDTIYKAIMYALHPDKNMVVWSGTPFNARDPLYKAVESGAWTTNVFPICERFPCEPEEFKGAWEDRFPYSYVQKAYEMALKAGTIAGFNQELLLRIMSDDERLLQDDDIKWYFRDTLLRNRESFNFYITTDFATSDKSSADFSVISVWAYNSEGSWFWVDGFAEKHTMDKNINALFHYVQKYKPAGVGIEVTGQQGGFVAWIKQEMLRKNIFFTLASSENGGKEGIRPRTNKAKHFDAILPLFKAGKISFPEELRSSKVMVEAMDELTLISIGGIKSKHDDFIDTVSMLSDMSPWKPYNTPKLVPYENDMWSFEIEEEIEYGYDSYLV